MSMKGEAFAEKLVAILDDRSYSAIFEWMYDSPEGEGRFVINDRQAFLATVLPAIGEGQVKWESFLKRISRGQIIKKTNSENIFTVQNLGVSTSRRGLSPPVISEHVIGQLNASNIFLPPHQNGIPVPPDVNAYLADQNELFLNENSGGMVPVPMFSGNYFVGRDTVNEPTSSSIYLPYENNQLHGSGLIDTAAPDYISPGIYNVDQAIDLLRMRSNGDVLSPHTFLSSTGLAHAHPANLQNDLHPQAYGYPPDLSFQFERAAGVSNSYGDTGAIVAGTHNNVYFPHSADQGHTHTDFLDMIHGAQVEQDHLQQFYQTMYGPWTDSTSQSPYGGTEHGHPWPHYF